MRLVAPVLILLALSLHPQLSHAQWQPDGTPISSALNDQLFPVSLPDGNGGAFIAWRDVRSGSGDIYAQRVNSLGVPQWTKDGVIICSAGADQANMAIESDGTGGAIIVWEDARTGNYDIYAQRVNSAGVVQWTANGVAVCVVANNQTQAKLVSDNATGAVITWQDLRIGGSDIYAQRLNGSGAPQWTANGVALCVFGNAQLSPKIVTDTGNGAIVTWEDARPGATTDIYAQKVNGVGLTQWAIDGVPICTNVASQQIPTMAPDGFGGAFIVWQDNRVGGVFDIFAQRVNSAGMAQWGLEGRAVSAVSNNQTLPIVVSDGSGGAIITWTDFRTGTSDLYAQRVTSTGAMQWVADGVTLCTAVGTQQNHNAVADGAGGVLVSWEDFRSGTYDIYVQRMNYYGAAQWTANGVFVSSSMVPGEQRYPNVTNNGTGGAIVSWTDFRSGFADIYSQRIEGTYGFWGHPEASVTSVADVKNDQGGKVAVNWTASGRDLPLPATIDFYSVWRAEDVAPSLTFGADENLITPNDVRADTPLGKRMKVQTSSYYWELVGTQTAYRIPSYSFSADTRADSVAADAGTTFFMVMAHDKTDEHIAFASNVVSGHSVDNLAPLAPLFLTAQRIGADVHLKWNRVLVPDLRNYAIYRQTTTGVTAVPVNFLSNADDTLLIDNSAPAGPLYYIVTAYDVHANQSAPSNEASVGASTGAGNLPPITALTVLQNRPNPFSTSATFDLGLPLASEVSVEVYDVAGRRVATRALGTRPLGWQSVTLDGNDNTGKPLASGVYFYRISAAGQTLTRKMVIAR